MIFTRHEVYLSAGNGFIQESSPEGSTTARGENKVDNYTTTRAFQAKKKKTKKENLLKKSKRGHQLCVCACVTS